jgi:hypothetical protein
MSNEKPIETTAPEVEINNVKELDEKLADAIENNPNKPSDEEVEEAKIKFEESSKNFSVKSWDIGKSEDGERNVQYLIHYVRNRIFWTKNGWMGVLKMMEELEDAEKFIKANPNSSLKLGYQALEFIFYSLQNPGGIGYEAAKSLQEEEEDYARVFDGIGVQIAEARKELKEIQFLQDQYAAMQQGFYLEVEPEGDDESPKSENIPMGDSADAPQEKNNE